MAHETDLVNRNAEGSAEIRTQGGQRGFGFDPVQQVDASAAWIIERDLEFVIATIGKVDHHLSMVRSSPDWDRRGPTGKGHEEEAGKVAGGDGCEFHRSPCWLSEGHTIRYR